METTKLEAAKEEEIPEYGDLEENQHIFKLSENDENEQVSSEIDEELEKGIPFRCDERELDKESPYLRSYEYLDDVDEEMGGDGN